MKKFIFFILTIVIFSRCSNDDNTPIDTPILGEWKLVAARIINFSTNPLIDYSNENIVYNFQANGILSVTGGNNPSYPDGDYVYEFMVDYLSGGPSPGESMIPLVKINNSRKWTYRMEDGKMTLGSSYIDGPDLFFERNVQ